MELYYNKNIINFGDTLNPWIWERMIPDLNEIGSPDSLFIGIGTILNEEMNKDYPGRKKIVFSSGYGYGVLPRVDSLWKFVCVRGPLTAQRLNLPPDMAVTDGALLLKRAYHFTGSKTWDYSYMPHISMASTNGDVISRLCADIGVNYIDPRSDTEAVLSAICSSHVLLAEAMHGAIAAEAFEVPWIPIKNSNIVNDFKWQDWCLSLELKYDPAMLIPVWHPENPFGYVKNIIKKRLFVSQLNNIIRNRVPIQSQKKIVESKIQALEEKIHQMRCRHLCYD